MNIVIIGGVAAGAKAGAKIKRLLPDSSVKIFTDDTHVSYSSCGLPYYIEGNFEDYRTLLVRSPEDFKASGIDVYLQTKVIQILPDKKKIILENLEQVKYDKLIIATGARPKYPMIDGIETTKNIYTLRKIEDGIKIRDIMRKSKNAVILGSGYIGLEILESFVKNGVHVDLIEHNGSIMPRFDYDMAMIIQERKETSCYKNFNVHLEDTICKVENLSNKVLVHTIKGKKIETDFVVLCSGVTPNVEIAENAGIKIGETGAIWVDKLMRTSVEDIYACGDCAEKTHIVSGQKVWIPLGSTANKEGRCAAINAAGGYYEFEGVLGSTVTRCLNTTIAMTGLTEKDAKSVGFSPVSTIIKKYDRVAYMPEASELIIKIVADKITGLLLGGQAVGSIGADKRINTLTTALLGHLTVQEFGNNDITYAPPYSTTIDPLLDAMNILCKKINREC
ncbi:FAD-dependent oxidoreductase [bacterium]|nr:FAD-dependent oxidoreductase [bacterium]